MSTTSQMPSNREWLRRLLSGQPHQVIPGGDNPIYLRRWYLIPRNPLLNVYLHQFLRDDDDRALHDHPWWFVSLILRGGYIEVSEVPGGRESTRCRTSVLSMRSPFWRRCIAFRPATWRHSVALPWGKNAAGECDDYAPRVPCWTLIVTGRRSRLWGFWCKYRADEHPTAEPDVERFVPWTEFGPGGCGEL